MTRTVGKQSSCGKRALDKVCWEKTESDYVCVCGHGKPTRVGTNSGESVPSECGSLLPLVGTGQEYRKKRVEFCVLTEADSTCHTDCNEIAMCEQKLIELIEAKCTCLV